jgi:hypothetical protein
MNTSILKSALFGLLTILFLFAARIVNAQESFSINGTVRDDSGVLPGATVFLNGTKAITACDNEGISV